MKILYTAHANAKGGRDGQVKSSDNVLDFKVVSPKELGGSGGAFTNPEQLFAAGYAACFDSAMRHVVRSKKIAGYKDSNVTARVGIGQLASGGFGLSVELDVTIEGLPPEGSQELMHIAHQVCPYSNATRNNIEVTLKLTSL